MDVSGPIVHDRNFDALCSQMVSTNESINLVKAFGPNQYDWIILIRQDLELLEFPDLNTLDPGKMYCGYKFPNSLKDDIFIFHPSLIPIFETVNALQTYQVAPQYIPNSEHIRYSHCLKYIHPDNIIPISTLENYTFNTIKSE